MSVTPLSKISIDYKMPDPVKDYLSVVYDPQRTPKTDYPSKLAQHIIERFRIVAGSHFLEVGCGRADFLHAFNEAGLVCSGVDREKTSAMLNPNLDIRYCDISRDRLPFPDNSFDVVYHKSVLEHIVDPTHLMRETMRVLKAGAKVVILTPDWHSQMKNFYEDFTHLHPYDKTAVFDLLTLSHFENVIAERFHQLPIIWRYPLFKVLSAMLRRCFSVYTARWLTEKTGAKFFRWSVELMVLGYAEKH